MAAKTTTPSLPARACSVGGRPVLHGAKRARVASHGTLKPWSLRFEAAATDLSWCRCRRASPNGVGCSAPRVGRKDNNAKSASARELRGRTTGSPRGEARADRAARESNAIVTAFPSRSRRPGAVSLKKSLGQRRGVRCWFERRERMALDTSTSTLELELALPRRAETTIYSAKLLRNGFGGA